MIECNNNGDDNIDKNTAINIVAWPNPEQWLMIIWQ